MIDINQNSNQTILIDNTMIPPNNHPYPIYNWVSKVWVGVRECVSRGKC